MNTRKTKGTENIENLCPIKGKRAKSVDTTASSTPLSSHWKYIKSETASSPSALSSDILAEMGIGMLDSEESSSSVVSGIALAVSGSGEENSNEATPNLDAPKFCHQRPPYLRPIDNSLDVSVDNGNSTITTMTTLSNDTLKDVTIDTNSSDSICHIYQRNENNNDTNMPNSQAKKNAVTSGAATTHTAWPSNASKVPRSPLAPLDTAACNSYFRNSATKQQQQLTSLTNATNFLTTTNPLELECPDLVNILSSSSSAMMPSTSQQAAALLNMQQDNAKLTLSKCEDTAAAFADDDDFFLFRQPLMKSNGDGINYFNILSDEIMLQIFKWLPKKALLRCSSVSQRFNRCVNDESLWTRLDLGGRTLRPGALEFILTRGVVILRLAQAELNHPIFDASFLQNRSAYETKLQYLDLSMVAVSKGSLKVLLSCCRQLKKLSLEHVPLNDEICNAIAQNKNLEALNVAMCDGLEAWSVRTMMESLKNLNSLNISWTNLSVDAITTIVTNVTPNLLRLNIAGCRKTMFDSHLASLAKRCPLLLELDLSDCTGLTGKAITIICKFKMLEYLSLSRCYLIPVSSYMELGNMSTLAYLDVFGMLSDSAMEMLEQTLRHLGINKFIHSSVARPTVGTRRTSVWGLRTRD